MTDGDAGTSSTEVEQERIEKTGVTPKQGLELDGLVHELELLAVDSHPKIDPKTVRIEDVSRRESGGYEVTISGEEVSQDG